MRISELVEQLEKMRLYLGEDAEVVYFDRTRGAYLGVEIPRVRWTRDEARPIVSVNEAL